MSISIFALSFLSSLSLFLFFIPLSCCLTAGLCGSPRLVDVGGVPYLVPLANREKLYDLTEVAGLAELPGAFMIGAGAGSSRVAGVNCEVSFHGNSRENKVPYFLD